MSLSDAAEPREPGLDFQFIAQVSDIFSSSAKTLADTNEKVSLIATAGKYGLIFVSDLDHIKVFRIASLIDGNNTVPVVTFRGKGIITHLSTSCDSQTLFVCAIVNEIPFSFFYDVFNIVSCTSQPAPFYATPLCTLPGSRVASLAWNPCDPCCIVAAISNGDLSLIKMKDRSMEFSSAKGIKANAVTWSSKGKQLAVGKHDGTISLFKPDLTHVRNIERPQNQEIGSVLNITWFTNTEFFIGYSGNNNTAPVLVYVNAPKGKVATFFSFEDVCYSSEREKPISYYSHFISEWNLLFVLSSNGIEMGVVGKSESSNASECQWCQWFLDDGARASMNFVNVVQETYPLGLAVDFTSTLTFVKDEQRKGPLPILLSLSTGGELNIFFVENRLTEFSNLNICSESIPSHGFRTSEQYGQNNIIPSPIEKKPTSVLQINRNAPSAFSFVPKNDAKASQSFSFSTPIKPLTSIAALTALSASPVTSPLVSSAEPLNTKVTPFVATFVPKPVSLSNEVGVSSNFSKPLHVPSPKKSLGGTFSGVSLPATLPASSTATPPALPSPSASLKESTSKISAPPPKASKRQLMQLIKGEMNNFEMEMLDNCNRNNSLQYKVGEKEDEQRINTALSEIKKWMSEIKKATHEVDEEVSQLHKNTFDALASYEDANSHCNIRNKSKNLMYLQLRPLDPYSHRRINEIRSKYYYLLSQISEVDSKLDSLWEEYATSKKSNSTRRHKQSTTDNLYRSVSNLHNSRVCFEKKLDQICMQLKKLYNNQIELSYLTNDLSLNSSNLEDTDSHFSSIISHCSKKQKPTSKKISNIQKILSERNVTPVRRQSILDVSKKLVSSRNFETTTLPISIAEGKISTSATPHCVALHNLLANNPLANAKYEDISPPISPEKISKSSNPLAALSSLVGKVSQPKDQKLSGFSFLDAATANKGASSHKEEHFNKTLLGTSVASVSNQSLNKSLPLTQNPKSTCSGLFSLSTLPVSSLPPLASMFKTNLANVPINTEVLSTSSTQSSVQQTSIPLTSSNSLFPAMFKNIPSNISISSKSEEGLMLSQGAETSLESFSESKTKTGVLFNADKMPTSSHVGSSAVFAKPILFNHSECDGSSPFSIQDSANLDSSKLDKDPFSSTIFGMQHITSSSLLFNQPLFTNVSSTIGQQNLPIDMSSKAPVMSSLSKLLPPQEISSSNASEMVSSSSSPGISVSSNSASPPIGIPISNNTSSILGLLTLNKSLASNSGNSTSNSFSSFGQVPSTSSTAFGQLQSTLFSQPAVTAAPSLFSKPIVSSDEDYITKTSGSIPLFNQDSSSISLFKQSSIFGQKTPPVGSASIFGGISTAHSTKTLNGDSTGGHSKAFAQDSCEQSSDPSSAPLFGLLPTTSTEQSVLPNFSSLLKPVTTNSSIFSQVSSATSVFGNPPETGNTFGQGPSLFTSTVSTNPSAIISSTASIFAMPSTTTTSIFTSNVSPNPSVIIPSTASIFAMPSTTTTSLFTSNVSSNPSVIIPSTASIFGMPSTTTTSLFTSNVSTNPSSTPSTASIFGTPPTTAPSVFEGNSIKSIADTSIFGSAQMTQSIFGNTGNVASNSALPISSPSNVFGSASVFGQSLPTASVAPSPPLFAASSNTGSIFGAVTESNSSIFGSSSQNSTSIFGASSPPSTVTVTSSQQSIFSSGFAQQGSSSNVFGGGSMFSGLGKAPSEENASKNVFGNLAGSSSSVPQTNLFGSSGGTASSFGLLANTSGSNASGGMGAFSPVKAGGTIFGGAPTFGGSPSFGSDLSKPRTNVFGGTPSFGSPPAFGSTPAAGGSVFGGTSAFGSGSAFGNISNNHTSGTSSFGGASTFGAGSPGSGFSSFANAGGATFGSLAGNQSSSNNNTSTFGGSSFSGWR